MASPAVVCLFCRAKVGTSGGSLTKLERHLRQGHDLHYNSELSAALHFLSEQETETLLTRIQMRIDRYKAEGILHFTENIFTTQSLNNEVELESSAVKKKSQVDTVDNAEGRKDDIDLNEGSEKEAEQTTLLFS